MNETKELKEIITEKLQNQAQFSGEKINFLQEKIGLFSTKIIVIGILLGYVWYFIQPLL
ncbi:MAG: hypothetical protein ACOVO2_02600 [Emticicia sp.]|uniref:hypothetical protein n=1 Tax=Emticicia sp. TaxID=1930953 RepID=UPI003BA7DAEC